MSHAPNEPPREPEGEERPPEGLVEKLEHDVRELGHEIGHVVEEAVEHVPAPVRWTVRKLVGLAALAIVGLVILIVVSVALYFANHTDLLAREVTIVLNGALARHSDVRIEIGDLRGNPFRQVRLVNPKIRFVDGDQPALLEAPWIQIQYSPLGLLRRDRRMIDVIIESPTIQIAHGADGRLRWPTWKPGPARASRPGDLALQVHVWVRRGAVRLPAPWAPVSGLELDAVGATGPSRATIRRLRWASGPYDTRNLDLAGEVTSGDSVRVGVSHLRTDALAARGRAVWAAGKSEKLVHLELDRVVWRWLAGVTANRTLDVPGQGRAVIDAKGSGEWEGRFEAAVDWNGLEAAGEGGLHWANDRLSLVPLTLRSEAGDLAGDVAWSKAGWEVGGDVVNGNPELWKSFGIAGWPAGNVQGTFRYAVDTRRPRTPSGNLTASLGPSELAEWRADQGTVVVRFPPTGPDSFIVQAQRRGGGLHLAGATNEGGWTGIYRVTDLPLDEWPDGRKSGIRGLLARGEGTVNARAGRLEVQGSLEGASTEWLGMRAARWRLDELGGALLAKPDLVARAALADVMFLGIHFDSVRTPFRLGDRTIALESLVATAGDTSLAMAGRADWDEGAWRLALDRASATSDQFQWTAEPPVRLAGDPRGVTFERLRLRDGAAGLAITGRWAAPGGDYDWTAEADALDLSRLGLPAEWGLGGTAAGTLRVTGRSGDPRWTFAAAVSGPEWDGHRGDTLELALRGRAAELEIEKLDFGLAGGRLAAQGAFRGMARAWPDTLVATGVERWLAGASSWEGEAGAVTFPIDRLHAFAPAAREWSGTLGGKVVVSGRPAAPVFRADVEAEPLRWRNIELEQVSARGRYAGGQLDVEEGRAVWEGRVSTVSGRMPLVLGLGRRPEVPDTEMAWRADVPNGDLALVAQLVPQIGSAAGRFQLQATVGGTPRKPDLAGTMTVSDGLVRMAGREELFEGVTARLRLDESRITVDSLFARQGRRGRVTGSGQIELAERALEGYRFDLDAREMTTSESGLYAAQFDGRFTVTDGARVHGQRLPHVTGNVEVRRAVILYDFANVSETEQVAQVAAPLYWTYRIQVTANSGVRWQPPDGDIEFSINLDVEQQPDELLIYGDMRALRGNYYFLSNRFAVERADLTFDHVFGVNPLLDAQARARVVPVVANPQAADASDQPHDVIVRLTGRARDPVIELTSDPPDWDQATILQELTIGSLQARDGGVPGADPLDNYISRALNRTLSEEMSRVFRGYISEWELARERGGLIAGQGSYILGVGTQVTPQLSLRYRQRLAGSDPDSPTPGTTQNLLERDVEAEYRLSRFIYVTSGLRQTRTYLNNNAGSTLGTDFNVNLRARWEY